MKPKNETFKDMFREAFDLHWDNAPYDEIRKNIIAGSRVKGTNMCILILAIFIASIGLNMNSTAVIIGAMLISPLMGGIMAVGYGIATVDLKLVRNATLGLFFQVTICIITSTIYFSLSPISTACSELLARTRPSIWDVLIAICGGLAGIIGVTRKEKGNVIPGVAIATALMPPLCTAGYGLATHQISFFTGAMYLFFINGFFICLSTAIVIKVMKVPCKAYINEKTGKKIKRLTLTIALLLTIPSIIWAYQLVRDTMFDNNVNNFLSEEFNFDGTQLVQSKVDKDKKTINVALIGKQLSEEKIENIKNNLASYNLSDMKLNVTQTEVLSGVTIEEIEELIKEGNKGANISDKNLEELKSEVVQYKAKLMQYEKEDYNVEEITKEMKALYPEITKCSIGTQKSWNDEKKIQEKYTIAIIKLPKHLTEEKHNQLVSWLQTKLSVDSVTVFEEVD
ncbi:MAG: DUF389 domain-containing protein [Clostridium sp.]|nr:DUF389 domain-containing protein [Clostridium sp.]MCI7443199.1 DUF389 domain-containing protein [Clostridium sp.]